MADVQITLVIPEELAARLDELKWSLRMSRRDLLRKIVREGVERLERDDPDADRIAWREAAGMLEALLSQTDPGAALSVREMFSCLDWGVTAEEEHGLELE